MWTKYSIVFLLALLIGCTREPVVPEIQFEEGLPAKVHLSLGNTALAPESRAGLTDAQEKAIGSVCVLVFDRNGAIVSNDYLPTFSSSTQISTRSGSNMTVYVVANLSAINAGTTPPNFLFNNVTTLNDMKNLKVATVGGDVEAAGNILMYGIKTGVSIAPTPSVTNIPVTLNYVASKIRVMVVSALSGGDQMTLTDWKLQDFAKYSFLEAQATDAVNPANTSDFLSSLAPLPWNDTLINVSGVQTAAKYALFYLFENRRGGRTTGAPTDTDPRNKTQYAPPRATAIVFNGTYNSVSTSTQTGFVAKVFFGANTYNDYNLQRSKDYSYLITVKGINEIDIDSRIDPTSSTFQADVLSPVLDAHYDWRPLRISSSKPGTTTFTIEILNENKQAVTSTFWLKVSAIDLSDFSSGARPVYSPTNDMKTKINDVSITGGNNKTYHLYADEFLTEGTTRTAVVRITSSAGGAPTEITITQKGYQTMGNVGLRKFDLLGAILQPLADYQLIVENKEEASMTLTPGASPGSEKTTTMQWGFRGTQMQLTSVLTVFDYYKRNGYANTYNLVYTSSGALRAPYGRTSSGTISVQAQDLIFNTYAARYCFEKNRDLDGNGKIEDTEIKWYLPSLDELVLVNTGEPSLSQLADEEISDNPYFSSTESSQNDEDQAMGLRPALGRTGPSDKRTPLNVRCVRALNATSATSPKITGLVTKTIDNSGFKSTSLRSTPVSRPVPVHVNTDAINKTVSPSFVVALTDYNVLLNPLVSWAVACGWTSAANSSAATGVVNAPARGCHAYSEGIYGAGQWRVPTQRELMLMYLTRKELLTTLVGFVDFAVNTNYWSSTANNNTEAFAMNFSSGIMYNQSKTSTYRVRCVRDL